MGNTKGEPTTQDVNKAMLQLADNQRILDYDTKEFTIELLVKKYGNGADDADIYVPSYQRRFNWDTRRQSRFIESLLVGLPVPFLFFGDMEDGRLEVVDGRQRLETCRAFLVGDLELEGLERLELLIGFRFEHLSPGQQRRFKNRTIRSVVLSQKATEEDRRDMFDRINTGSLVAEPVETRRGAITGPMSDLIDSLANDKLFRKLCPISAADQRKREGEELVTRLFAFGDGLQDYKDRISEHLSKWLKEKNAIAASDPKIVPAYRTRFHTIMKFVESHFPHGFTKKPQSLTTPRVRFDAIGVGVWLAIKADPKIKRAGPRIPTSEWIQSDDFFQLTTSSAANVRSKILNRSEFVKLMILGLEKEARSILHDGED